MIVLQIVAIILCMIFLVYVARLVAHERLLLKYSLLWMALAIVILLCAIFPQPLYDFAHLFGFENPSNFIFFIGLFFLLAIALSLSSIASKQAIKIKNLVQEQALLAKRIDQIESVRPENVDSSSRPE
ncbi:DUF2304 domain-containing protein [Eggerthella guodeyinii]|uniref:DUF2304 family protein n=1 Tax=Eggerthella guodeyinii TaxID=2690837 RepID=A0A6N7RSI9_9ACTN|nr:DUF2304 domain-containing protein [Eggerthella guodeyinii]MRX83670.1 DUF2304 family protein [Eggerthella guodeyinii]